MLRSTEVRCADAAHPDTWWDGRPFDAILLDAPCTASGIVRRHPDVRWLRRDSDVAALAQTQRTLLDALWPLLRPGGRLVYATCSVFRAEGSEQAQAFLQRHTDAHRRNDRAVVAFGTDLGDQPASGDPHQRGIEAVGAGDVIAEVHASSDEAAEAGATEVAAAYRIGAEAPEEVPIVLDVIA